MELPDLEDGLHIPEDEVLAGSADAFDVNLHHVGLDSIEAHLEHERASHLNSTDRLFT